MSKSNNNILTIGLDIGYGVSKAITAERTVTFPSVCGHARQIRFRADDVAQRYPGDQISDGQGDWFVGDLALSQVPTGELLRLRGRTANKDAAGNDFRLRLAKAAIGKLLAGQRNGDRIEIQIATGLPVDHMPQANDLKRVLAGLHRIETDTVDVVADIQEVMVMPQPYGTIYANTLTEDGAINRRHTANRTGVVDIGTYTIDLALDDCGEYIDAASGSVEGGVYTAQERLAGMLESDFGEKPTYRDVEKTLLTGKYHAYGEDADYRAAVQEALEPLRSAVLNLISTHWHTGAALDVIYLSGGGAQLVADLVSKSYRQAQLVSHAQLANARGFLNYALFVLANA